MKKTPKTTKKFFQFHDDGNTDHGHPKYDTWEPKARTAKIVLQMLIGVLLALLLGTKFFFKLFCHPCLTWHPYLHAIYQMETLLIVSKALAYSAGIELAYMLFTPGPDEAIEPLITSAASGLMYVLASEHQLTIQTIFSLLLYVLVIASLFMIKEIFAESENKRKRLIDILRNK
ncbi:MAG: hypothetical protein HZB18_02935 [Chloroflexi bacterium]|nr:hypothetical protein [Chloroflexota bacterium]